MLDAVMQPFVRLEESRSRDTGGTGLGLAIAGQLAGSWRAASAGRCASTTGPMAAGWPPSSCCPDRYSVTGAGRTGPYASVSRPPAGPAALAPGQRAPGDKP
ncbi:hypothetical protein [Roseomonas sp. KE2513]|uniref:hypothetical protein n=1 Tax=Roseomonas sp. KE2513 TaxID=2479202 RepID=UPI0035C9E265